MGVMFVVFSAIKKGTLEHLLEGNVKFRRFWLYETELICKVAEGQSIELIL